MLVPEDLSRQGAKKKNVQRQQIVHVGCTWSCRGRLLACSWYSSAHSLVTTQFYFSSWHYAIKWLTRCKQTVYTTSILSCHEFAIWLLSWCLVKTNPILTWKITVANPTCVPILKQRSVLINWTPPPACIHFIFSQSCFPFSLCRIYTDNKHYLSVRDAR